MQSAEAAVERGLKGIGLTVRTRAVLEVLLVEKEASVPDIAEKLEIKLQYVQLMVNETITEGLTVRRENPRHERQAGSSVYKITALQFVHNTSHKRQYRESGFVLVR